MKKELKQFIVNDQQHYYRSVISISKRLRTAKSKNKKSIIDYVVIFFLTRRRNSLCAKRNVWIQGEVGNNLHIYHPNVIINHYAKIGNNAIFHGNNCIGNNGKRDTDCPTIGDNVDIGYGACIYGKVIIANNVTIGAGSVVVRSITEDNVVVAGVPAKIIAKKEAA